MPEDEHSKGCGREDHGLLYSIVDFFLPWHQNSESTAPSRKASFVHDDSCYLTRCRALGCLESIVKSSRPTAEEVKRSLPAEEFRALILHHIPDLDLERLEDLMDDCAAEKVRTRVHADTFGVHVRVLEQDDDN